MIFSIGNVLTGAYQKTVKCAAKHNKQCMYIHPGTKHAAQKLRDFVADYEIETRRVAGPG